MIAKDDTNGAPPSYTEAQAHAPTPDDESIVDVLIVGGGFAGLSAAQTLALQQHSSVVFDSGPYRNWNAQHVRMMPGWDGRHPEDLRAAQRKDLAQYKHCLIHPREVIRLERISDRLFHAIDSDEKVWKGRKVILATGVQEVIPDLEGYKEGWTKFIFHCMYSSGTELRGSPSCGVLALAPLNTAGMAMQMGHITARVAQSVTFYTNGDTQLGADIEAHLKAHSQYKVDTRPLRRVSKSEEAGARVSVEFEGGESAEQDFLAHMPMTRARGPFAEQLKIDLSPMGDYATNPPFEETNVKGVFATGDAASMFKVAPIASTNAAFCASGVVCRLHEEELGIPGLF